MRRSMSTELFRISDLRFQIEETPNSNANADPSPLKRVRDDGVNQSQKPHAQLRRMGHPDPNANATANLHCAGALGVEFVC